LYRLKCFKNRHLSLHVLNPLPNILYETSSDACFDEEIEILIAVHLIHIHIMHFILFMFANIQATKEVPADQTRPNFNACCLRLKHSKALSTSLAINFGKKTAKLAINPFDTESPEVVYFKNGRASKEVSVDEPDEYEYEDLEFSFTRLDVFEVLGSGRHERSGGNLFKVAESIFAPYWPDASGPRITGQELKQRIQGFGSN
jgi:hypothetical protein